MANALRFAPGWSIAGVGGNQVAGHLVVPSAFGISGVDPTLTVPVQPGDVYGVMVACEGGSVTWSNVELFTVTAGPPTTVPPPVTTTPTPVTTTSPTAGPLSVSANQVKAGDSVTISGDGFAPGAALVAELHSKPVRLSAFSAGAGGSFTTTVKIPADTTPGLHEIVVVGAGLDGVQTVTADITVVAALAAVATTATPVHATPKYTG